MGYNTDNKSRFIKEGRFTKFPIMTKLLNTQDGRFFFSGGLNYSKYFFEILFNDSFIDLTIDENIKNQSNNKFSYN